MRERRGALREFQARLSERLQNAAEGEGIRARLGLLVGEKRWLLDLAEAGEIMPVPAQITPVPLTESWFKGLVNLRGALYGVADFAEFSGEARTALGKETRLLAFSSRLELNAAILVSRMLGLHNTEHMTKVPTERASPDAPWAGARWTDAQGFEWNELSLARLCESDRFRSVGR
ncbi:MAG: chemotaxis protein CheW [Burkholderiaceae bacterium]|nr:chemotaxis protein CheW [Burkholderiaceae bacterium]